jgi:brefeldin A-resistance guanine nucleotide exchange factor 1
MDNAVNCIKGEIHNVIASLRLGWAAQIPFLADFKNLHESLCEKSSQTDISELDTLKYFTPFLTIIQSEQTSGVVTHVALSAVNKFILYGFLPPRSPQTADVLCRTVEAVSQCRFESIEKTGDEQVYLQVCTVLLHCIICPGGSRLTDGAVWLCIKTCHDISTHRSLSDIVRRHAEDVLMQMVLTVFSTVSRATLHGLEGGADGDSSESPSPADTPRDTTEEDDEEGAESESASSGSSSSPSSDASSVARGAGTEKQQQQRQQQQTVALLADDHLEPPASGMGERGRGPYGSQVLLWIMKWLLQMCKPSSAADAMSPTLDTDRQVFGLNQINVALETSAHMIGRVPAIVDVIGNELCKYLLQNTQTEDVTLLSLTLRVIFNLFNSSMKTHLKVQLEVFFNTIHLRIPAAGSAASFEKRELASLFLLCLLWIWWAVHQCH